MRSLVLGLVCLCLCCSTVQPDQRRPRSVAGRQQNETAVQNRRVENPCRAIPLDFVFVIDSSRSIRPNDYEKVKTFLIDLLQFLSIGPDETRVGLLQYGSVVQPEFSLDTHTSKAEVEQAVRNMQHLATGTMTGLAIQYTMETAFAEERGARPASLHIPRIAMIVTDGRPQDSVEEVAAQAREAGIQIFAIGVGRVDTKTLKAIGSEPHSEHVHLVANFSQIETLTSVFRSKLCGGSDMCAVVDHQCQHVCVSSPASYRCQCRRGFALNPDGRTCEEMDHCADGSHGCEHDFMSINGSCVCNCRKGYKLGADGKTCTTEDVCAVVEHGCGHICVNLPDGYECGCHPGYQLNADRKTCHKIDHCAEGTHGCEQEFMNTADSCACKCRKGYTLRADGKTCQEDDPCADGKHGCEQDFISTDDACVCTCRDGYTLRPDGRTCQGPECGDGAMDLVFVIDGSKSLGPGNFELVKQLVNSVVDSLDVSQTGTHVGLLQFSTKVRTEFTLGQYSAARDVRRAVAAMQYMGRGSMTGSALRHMFESSFSAKEGARPNVPRVSVVFTDGRSQDDVSEWATKAKSSGITMYALGVGKAIEQELKEIASEPAEKHFYYAEDFEKMAEITQKLKSRMCKDKPSDENTCQCENVIMFQNQVTEKLKSLLRTIDSMSRRLETLENQIV